MSDRRNQPIMSELYPDWEPARDQWRAEQAHVSAITHLIGG